MSSLLRWKVGVGVSESWDTGTLKDDCRRGVEKEDRSDGRRDGIWSWEDQAFEELSRFFDDRARLRSSSASFTKSLEDRLNLSWLRTDSCHSADSLPKANTCSTADIRMLGESPRLASSRDDGSTGATEDRQR